MSQQSNSVFSLTLPRVQQKAFALDAATIKRGVMASRESPRLRIMLQIHRSPSEGVQRLVNFMQKGSYARPHLHPGAECIETSAIVQGSAAFIVFNDDGTVKIAHRLKAGDPASVVFDLEQGLWHTVVPLSEDVVILEIKRGPYNAATDKRFAPWAPEEGAPGALEYLRSLEALFG